MSVWFRAKNEQEIANHIKKEEPSLYLQSKTSTVINYNNLEKYAEENKLTLVDLSLIKPQMEWKEEEKIKIRGAVTWQDMKNFALTKSRRVMTSPTEELAGVLAGIATSCTGEHAFGFGTIRDQIESCRFINYKGERILLDKKQSIEQCGLDHQLIVDYANIFTKYKNFKNAPFPRLQQATDLMIGSEGQLGVIVEAVLNTAPLEPSDYYFILVPKWEYDYSSHLEILEKVQTYRRKILTVELIDWNSLSYLPKTEWSQKPQHDVIFMEVLCKNSEEVFENILAKLSTVAMENIFSYDEGKFNRLRKAVPRFVNEVNSRKGVVKKGTDVQISTQEMHKLFDYYRQFSKLGINYNLFGHFGDAHLHFNFLPSPNQITDCDNALKKFYLDLAMWNVSPFAEHGIGIIKQKFISHYWSDITFKMFKHCKEVFDPKGIFFPQGFMNLKSIL